MSKISWSKIIIFFSDTVAISLAIAVVFMLRTSDVITSISATAGARFQPEILLFYSFAGLGLLPLFSLNNLYRYKVLTLWSEQLVQIIKSFLTLAIVLIVILFFFKNSSFTESERGYLLGFTSIGILVVGLERLLITRLVRKKILLANEIELKKVLIIGAGRAGEMFALRILNEPELGIENAWFVDDDEEKVGKFLLGFPIYGGVNNIVTHAFNTGADEIYIVINSIAYNRLLEIIELCKKTQIPVKISSQHLHIVRTEGKIGANSTVSSVEVSAPYAIRPGVIAKRIFDLFGGLIISLIVLIPSLIVALLVKLTSKGPIFYMSNRIGKNGKTFQMLKFRTMYVNDGTEHIEAAKQRLKEGKHMGKVENDPRITPIGRFLRKYSIDELPQIINVLRGEMSLVGPRPCLPYEMELFDDWHKRRFLVLPGLTGLWQVTGRQMKELALHDAMILDVFYAENFTIWLDVKILLKTIPVVLFGKGGK